MHLFKKKMIKFFDYFQVLPSWNNTLGGSLSYKFRTNEATGLLLFNPGMAPGSVSLILQSVNIFLNYKKLISCEMLPLVKLQKTVLKV